MCLRALNFVFFVVVACQASAAVLTFANIRPQNLTAGAWRIDGGSAFDPNANTFSYSNNGLTTNTAQSGTWSVSLNGLDLLGDSGSYDVTVSIDVNGFNTNFNSGNQRFFTNYNTSTGNGSNPGNVSTFTLSNAQVTIVNASGSSNMVDAGDLSTSFNGFTELRAVSIGNSDEAEITGDAVAGGSITNQTINRTTSGGNNGANYAFSEPASSVTMTAVAGGNVGFRNFDGGFTIFPIPEPTSVVTLGIGSLLLFAYRRRTKERN